MGISCFALPLYSAEISTPEIRGATGSLFQLNVVVGCASVPGTTRLETPVMTIDSLAQGCFL